MAAITGTQEQNVTGEELFRRYLAGYSDAFETLVSLYDDELYHFINRIVNDYHDAKHLTIEAFAQLAIGGSKFANESSLKTYLFTIGKNLAARYMKKRGAEQHISFEEVVGLLVDESETPESYLEREENKRMLHEAMKGLKDDHRVILVLLYFEDMSYMQAGRAMRKSEKQIKQLAYRAKAALKKNLESGGFTYI